MSEKQDEREILEENNEQEGVSQHKTKKYKILKNEKLRNILK